MRYVSAAIFLPGCPSTGVMLNAVEFSPYPTDVLARTCEYQDFVNYKEEFYVGIECNCPLSV